MIQNDPEFESFSKSDKDEDGENDTDIIKIVPNDEEKYTQRPMEVLDYMILESEKSAIDRDRGMET